MRSAQILRLAAIGLAGLVAFPAGGHGQTVGLKDGELELGGGVPIVNADAWVAPGSLLSDNRRTYGGAGRVFLFDLGPLHAGVELGHFNYWSYRAAFASTGVRADVEADQVGIVTRLVVSPRFGVDLGASVQLFEGFTDAGVHTAVHYAIPIKPEVSIPIGVRAALILDGHATLIPIMVTAGIALKP